MPWIEPPDCPDYCFLDTGELQYRDRFGRFAIAGGCNGDDWFRFVELRQQALDLLVEAGDTPPDELYLHSDRLRWLCDQCLRYSGIDPLRVAAKQVIRLLFAREENGKAIPAPLVTLSEPPGPRHPPISKDGAAISDKASLLAALISQCQSLAEVDELMSRPMREILAIADDAAWNSQPAKERHRATMKADAKNSMARIDQLIGGAGNG